MFNPECAFGFLFSFLCVCMDLSDILTLLRLRLCCCLLMLLLGRCIGTETYGPVRNCANTVTGQKCPIFSQPAIVTSSTSSSSSSSAVRGKTPAAELKLQSFDRKSKFCFFSVCMLHHQFQPIKYLRIVSLKQKHKL